MREVCVASSVTVLLLPLCLEFRDMEGSDVLEATEVLYSGTHVTTRFSSPGCDTERQVDGLL